MITIVTFNAAVAARADLAYVAGYHVIPTTADRGYKKALKGFQKHL
jgi:hypothetical protein